MYICAVTNMHITCYEHMQLLCKSLVKSGFFDVYIQGKRDGVFSSINPTELKSLFRKWPIINCKVVCCSYALTIRNC